MHKGAAIILVWLMVLSAGLAFAGEEHQPKPEQDVWYAPKNFSASLAFTTDYVFRGLSQTDGKPAAQASLTYTHPTGFYVGTWASNVNFTPGDTVEIDGYVGFADSFVGIGYDLSFLYYAYPGARGDPKPDYLELHLGLSYTLPVEWPVVPTLAVGYYYSPDYLFEDGTGNYVNATLDLALPMAFGIAFEGGYQYVQGGELTGNGLGENGGDGYDYFHYRASVYKEIFGFNLDLSFHNIAGIDKNFFGDVGDERVVFTITCNFN